MKAAIFKKFGKIDVLQIEDIPQPKPNADQVLVRVRAAAVNPKDTFIRKGRFQRFTGTTFPMQTGFDYAGEVAEVGANIHSVTSSDAVFGFLDGWHGATCAEYVLVTEQQIAKKPANLSFEQAAAIPLVSVTALQAFRDKANIKLGQRVCINGASGGVGSMAVQIAKLYGAFVTAISRNTNCAFLNSLGADACVDYQQQNITDLNQSHDIFFDVFGNQPFDRIKPILTKRGVWISTVIRPHVFGSMLKTKFFSNKKAKMIIVKSNQHDLNSVREWAEDGLIDPIVSHTFSMEDIQNAHAQQESKHTRGKIVVRAG